MTITITTIIMHPLALHAPSCTICQAPAHTRYLGIASETISNNVKTSSHHIKLVGRISLISGKPGSDQLQSTICQLRTRLGRSGTNTSIICELDPGQLRTTKGQFSAIPHHGASYQVIALEGPGLPRTYLAHHELESVVITILSGPNSRR